MTPPAAADNTPWTMRLSPTDPSPAPSAPDGALCALPIPTPPPSRCAQVDALEDEIGDEVQARLALKTKLEQEAQLRERASELAETRERQTRGSTSCPRACRICRTRSTWRTTCGRRSPRTSPS